MGTNPVEPLLLSIPESFESERLLIRAALWGDGAAVNEAVKESAEALRPWMPWAHKLPSVEESEISIRRSRIEIRCDSRNTQSARVAERLGFALEGILRNDKCDVDGTLRDTMIFAKVRGVEF